MKTLVQSPGEGDADGVLMVTVYATADLGHMQEFATGAFQERINARTGLKPPPRTKRGWRMRLSRDSTIKWPRWNVQRPNSGHAHVM